MLLSLAQGGTPAGPNVRFSSGPWEGFTTKQGWDPVRGEGFVGSLRRFFFFVCFLVGYVCVYEYMYIYVCIIYIYTYV